MFTESKLYDLVLVVLGTIGTLLVGFGILTAEENQEIQAYLPTLGGVIAQGVSIVMALINKNKTESELKFAKQEIQIRDAQVKALNAEVAALKKVA